MKLEVGMYVRTKHNGILKINKHTEEIPEAFKTIIDERAYNSYDILKSSHNIIDLIEVGDYVNGRKVTNVWEKELVLYAGSEATYIIKNEEIKSILTHEQYEANCYKVVE